MSMDNMNIAMEVGREGLGNGKLPDGGNTEKTLYQT